VQVWWRSGHLTARIDGGCKFRVQIHTNSLHCVQGGPKNWTILRVFATVIGARNACDMSKFSKFYPEKNIKLACQCV